MFGEVFDIFMPEFICFNKILEDRYREEIRRSELMMKLAGVHRQLNGLEEHLLIQGGAPALTGEATRLAANFGLQIESAAPKEELPLPPYRKLQIEIYATASFSSLLLFLHALETHQPLLWVSELEIERPIPASALYPSTAYQGSFGSQPPLSMEELDPELQTVRITVAALSRAQEGP